MPNELQLRPEAHQAAEAERAASRTAALSINDLDRSEFRNIPVRQEVASTSTSLPRLELVEGANEPSRVAETPERSLRRQVSESYSTPELRARGERFSRDMDLFTERARASGMSEREVSETFRQVSRILDAGSDARLPHTDRLALASQVMHNAAHPMEIRQNENTCNVTSLEVRTYMRQPSAAAALVADVATRGSFSGHDGTTVRLDNRSLTPSVLGTTELEQEPSRRNFASQLFQVTAANIANILDPDFRSMRYEQRPPRSVGDFGEALVDVRTGQVVEREPGAAGRPNGLIAANESITGRRDEADAFIVNQERYGRTASRAATFTSADDLGQTLERLASSGRMPAVVFVHANSELLTQPTRGETRPADRETLRQRAEVPANIFNDGHFVTITGYDPITRTVRYDDQYGPESDRNDRPVSLDTFYRATNVVRANELIDRLVSARGHMSQAEFARNLTRLTRIYAERWQLVESAGGTALSPEVRADRDSATRRILVLSQGLTLRQRQVVEASMRSRTAIGTRQEH